MNHTYSAGLYDEAGPTAYTPGVSQRQACVDSYFHDDYLGSTRHLTDNAGTTAPTFYRYDAPRSGGKPSGTSRRRRAGRHLPEVRRRPGV